MGLTKPVKNLSPKDEGYINWGQSSDTLLVVAKLKE